MSNIGRKIEDFYCNGFAGRRYDLEGSIIEHEGDDYMIIRTDKGEPIFIGFFTFDNGEIYKDGWHYKDKQKMIDTWCGEENEH
jgi:capsid portal protein